MSSTLLTLPFNFGGQQYNDGDYMTLSAPLPTSILNGPVMSYDYVPGSNGTPQTFKSPAIDFSPISRVYICATKTVLESNQLTVTKAQQTDSTNPQDFAQFNVSDNFLLSTPLPTDVQNDCFVTSNQLIVQNNAFYIATQPGPGPPQTAAGVNQYKSSIYPDQYHTGQQVIADNKSSLQLCIESHANEYIALRAADGRYLHVLPAYSAASSTYTAPAGSDYIVTFSSLSSANFSAQFHVYATASGGLVLRSRVNNLCVTVGNIASTAAVFFGGFGMVATNGNFATPSYTNGYPVTFGQYAKPYARLLCTTPISMAISAPNCVFTIAKPVQTCNPAINPLSAACSGISPSQIMTFCSTADLLVGRNCTRTARETAASKSAAYDAMVANYCALNPNNTDYCGCMNTWPYQALQDLLSYLVPPTAILPSCNLASCSANQLSYKTSGMILTNCNQQICNIGTSIGNVTDSTITKIQGSCTFSS